MAAGSAYAGTVFLKGLLYVHLFFAVSTVCLWSATLYDAVRRFGRRPRPIAANSSHKKIAWISVADMVGTVVTGMMVYYYGFMN